MPNAKDFAQFVLSRTMPYIPPIIKRKVYETRKSIPPFIKLVIESQKFIPLVTIITTAPAKAAIKEFTL